MDVTDRIDTSPHIQVQTCINLYRLRVIKVKSSKLSYAENRVAKERVKAFARSYYLDRKNADFTYKINNVCLFRFQKISVDMRSKKTTTNHARSRVIKK